MAGCGHLLCQVQIVHKDVLAVLWNTFTARRLQHLRQAAYFSTVFENDHTSDTLHTNDAVVNAEEDSKNSEGDGQAVSGVQNVITEEELEMLRAWEAHQSEAVEDTPSPRAKLDRAKALDSKISSLSTSGKRF